MVVGDALEVLRGMPAESVHCVVTSPPYFGLRDYGVAGQMGLETSPEVYLANMVAVFREVRRVLRKDGTCWVNMGDSYAASGRGSNPVDSAFQKQASNRGSVEGVHTDQARRAPSGFKPKDLMGMPWRLALALQADGWYLRCDIIWQKPNPMPESVRDRPTKAHEYVFLLSKSPRYFYDAEAVKEPVTGTAHARGGGVNPKARGYKMPDGWATGPGAHGTIHPEGREKGRSAAASEYPGRDARDENTRRAKTPGKNSRIHVDRDVAHGDRPFHPRQNESFSAAVAGLVSKRNIRSVWTIAPAPYRKAHFATFPSALVRPCILAGTSEAGCCQVCGVPWVRVTSKGEPDLEHQRACGGDVDGNYHGQATKDFSGAKAQNASEVKARILAGMRETQTICWKPGCKCEGTRTDTDGHGGSATSKKGHSQVQLGNEDESGDNPQPCIVLDPFGGSGTTAEVAVALGRHAVLIELNPEYLPLIQERVEAGKKTRGLGDAGTRRNKRARAEAQRRGEKQAELFDGRAA